MKPLFRSHQFHSKDRDGETETKSQVIFFYYFGINFSKLYDLNYQYWTIFDKINEELPCVLLPSVDPLVSQDCKFGSIDFIFPSSISEDLESISIIIFRPYTKIRGKDYHPPRCVFYGSCHCTFTKIAQIDGVIASIPSTTIVS